MNPLYLSRLRLTIRNRDVQRDLSDCHAMHRQLLLAFPNLGGVNDARDRFGVLYRLEPDTEPGAPGIDILLQSTEQPDWSRLPDGYLREPATPAKRIDPLYAAIAVGQHLLFRLRANPTRRISDRNATQEQRWRGKRVELRREEDQSAWLHRKGEQSGFIPLALRTHPAVPDVRATAIGAHVIGRHPAGRLTLASVTFEGRLRVTDPDAFRQALWQGIGSGKAFGFGLLSIAPVSS